MLWDIVREWSGIMADGFASHDGGDESHLTDTYFAWSGPITNGGGYYASRARRW